MEARSIERALRERLSSALSELRRERRRTTDELEALGEFEDRVRAVDPERNVAETGGPTAVVSSSNGIHQGLTVVRVAYEETVMSVPHYDEEYDDSYAESLAGEFSPDIAAALTGSAGFTARHKRTLLAAVSEAQRTRKSLLEAIERERDSVKDTREALVSIAAEVAEIAAAELGSEPFGALDAYRARLGVLADGCSERSEQRQREIFSQRRVQRLPSNAPDVAVYFYQALDVDYPIIASIAELAEAIETLRARIERAMATA